MVDIGGSASAETSHETEDVTTSGVQTQQLELEDEAIDKLIEDVLGGADGLASIFAGEQSNGLFNSSVANQAAGDLTANLVGELAKLTGKTTTTSDGTTNSSANANTANASANFSLI